MSSLKTQLKDLVLADLQAQLASAEESTQKEIHESKQHKGAMASRYDTFKEEAQAMMGAHQVRMAEIKSAIALVTQVQIRQCTQVAVGSIFCLTDEGSDCKYFLLPGGGGNTYDLEGETIVILNSIAPLARQLLRAVEGDDVEVKVGGKTKTVRVHSIE